MVVRIAASVAEKSLSSGERPLAGAEGLSAALPMKPTLSENRDEMLGELRRSLRSPEENKQTQASQLAVCDTLA